MTTNRSTGPSAGEADDMGCDPPHRQPGEDSQVDTAGDLNSLTSLEFDAAIRAGAQLLRDRCEQQTPSQTRTPLPAATALPTMGDNELAHADTRSTHQTLGNWRLLECLGVGGMGRVYRAIHPKLGRTQAVKILHADRLRNPEALARFHQEMVAIGRLNHPHIVAAHHADEQDGVPFLVMEFIDGESLSQLVRRLRATGDQLPLSKAVDYILQAAQGMQYAHEQGILHRDLKPSNLLLDRQGNVYVSDLGLARIRSLPTADQAQPTIELTGEGIAVGTLDFMAPEQLRNSRLVDERADVYALAATLFYLLTGKNVYPVDSNDPLVKISSILHDPVPAIRNHRADVPAQIEHLLQDALAKDPSRRIESMAQLIERLKPWCTSPAKLASHVNRTTRPSSDDSCHKEVHLAPLSPRRPLVIGTAVILALCFIIIAGIVIKLSLPGMGTLIVESSDPHLSLTVQQLNGPARESWQIDQGTNGPLKIRVGTWELSIDGPNSAEYQVSPNQIEIGKNAETTIRIEKIAAIVPPTDDAIAQNSAPTAPTTPTVTTNSDLIRLESNWKVGTLDLNGSGLIAQPADLDQSFQWQAYPIRAASGIHASEWERNPSDLDPQEEWMAWATGEHAVIVDAQSMEVKHIFLPPSDSPVGWVSVKFSPAGDQIVLVSRNGYLVEIRNRQGRLLSSWRAPNWNNEDQYFPNAIWLTGEDRLLFAGPRAMCIVDLQGHLLARWRATESSSPIVRAEESRSSPGDIVLLNQTGKLWVWNPRSNSETEILSLANWPSDSNGNFAQSPDGSQILTWQIGNSERSDLWSLNGELLATVLEKVELPVWSPNGLYLVDNNRNIRDAQSLALVKRLELDERDTLRFSPLRPAWPHADEIVLISYHPTLRSETGEIRRFHPTGRQLATRNLPQPLGPLSAIFLPDNRVRAFYGDIHHQGTLVEWNSDARGAEFQATPPGPPHQGHVALEAQNRQTIVPVHHSTLALVDKSGQVIQEFADRSLQRPTWSPDGSIYSFADKGVTKLLLFSALSHELLWEYDCEYPMLTFAWSPDGNWLGISTSSDRIFLIHWGHPDRPVRELRVTDHHHFDYPLQFSPDSKWLATCRNIRQSTDSELFVVKLSSLHEQRLRIEERVDASNLVWALDSQRLLVGDRVVDVQENELTLRKLATQIPRDSLLRLALPDHAWLTFGNTIANFETTQGQLLAQIGTGLRLAAAQFHRHQSLNETKDRAIWLGLLPRAANIHTAIVIADTQSRQVLQTLVAFSDQTTIALNAAGAVIDGPQDLDRYLVHAIRYPGGKSVAVTRQQLHERIAASAEQKALLWAADHSIKVFLNQAAPQFIDSRRIDSLPPISDITQLDLSETLELSDAELQHLTQFKSVRNLGLSRTPITSLPDLQDLNNLETLDVSYTNIANIDSLAKLTNLRELNLAGTKIDAEATTIISNLKSLQSLNLSQTNLNGFALLDLNKLSALRRLDVSGLPLKPAELDGLKKSMPNCEIITSGN